MYVVRKQLLFDCTQSTSVKLIIFVSNTSIINVCKVIFTVLVLLIIANYSSFIVTFPIICVVCELKRWSPGNRIYIICFSH